jgi:1-acyl-sn-glycerol-3-phosphate acyltransferase
VTDWREETLAKTRIGPTGWFRVLWRGGVLGFVVFGGLAVLLLLRLIERPLFGRARPITPFITQGVCRMALTLMRLPLQVKGEPMVHLGAMVANHASWLDIFALNACARVYFVAKAEVAGWAGIGWLARATGTLFIQRKGTEAKVQQAQFEARLRAGHRLLFFPEGTSTDSLRVLPFKSTLFAAFFTHGMEHVMHIQPVTLNYRAPKGADPRHYGWWGDMEFAGHLLLVLATPRQGSVEVIFHPEVAVDDFADRKALSMHCEQVIRTGSLQG